jgi:dipeptidyl aminopeptidase/acylaminoacyl peptidase
MTLPTVNKHTKALANLDINKLNPIDFVKKITVPVFFIAGTKDVICPLKQVKKMFNAYGGPKELKIVN